MKIDIDCTKCANKVNEVDDSIKKDYVLSPYITHICLNCMTGFVWSNTINFDRKENLCHSPIINYNPFITDYKKTNYNTHYKSN